MAIRKLNDGVGQYSNNMPFPQDRYQIRCVEESFAPSSGGNPMITREWEIISPETIQLGDKTIGIVGTKVVQYLVCKVKDEDGDGWDSKKSDKAFSKLAADLGVLGIDPSTEVDDENPPLIAKGKVVQAILYAKEDARRKAPTPEQLSFGQRVGDIIKDENGKDVKSYRLNIGEILGLSNN